MPARIPAWAVWAAACLAGCPEPSEDRMVHIQDGDLDYWVDAFEFPNRQGTRPTHGVSLAEAEAMCAEASKRLCTAAEWRRACRGPGRGARFGYGPRLIPNICRVGIDSGGHTSLLQGRAPTEADRTAEGTAAAAGSYLDCATPEGVHDLVGNVEEWVLDDFNGRGGSLEGGAWYTWQGYADCSGRYSRQPDYRLDDSQPVASAGFRCCRSDAPLTESLRARDAEARLQAPAPPDYDPAAEIEVSPGLFMDTWEFPNRPGSAPLAAVTWTTARDHCDAAGKRLCTTTEWERACAGSAGTARPYGEAYVAAACAVALDEPPVAGAHLACASDRGVRDLVGSVWEWTATPLDEPALSPSGDPLRELRGGSWMTDGDKAICAPADGYPAAAESARHADLGFRCCRGQARQQAAELPPPSRCPDRQVFAHGVCIDAFEHPSQVGGRPRGGLSWAEATAACDARGARVCTEAEWSRACEGPARRRWPYGDVYARGACNLAALGEGDTPDLRAADPSGACVTPEGAHDLSGNVWEWTATADGEGVLRGGGWDLGAGLGQCRARATPDPTEAQPAFGVRCCSDSAAPR